MKRILNVLTALLLLGAMTLPGAFVSKAQGRIAGDVNGDGRLNAKDVTAEMKYLVGAVTKNFDVAAADFNGDGKVNAKDVAAMMRRIVGVSYSESDVANAYKKFVDQKHHDEKDWSFDITHFSLYDLNSDGIPELFTLGGGNMDYTKVFTYKNGKVTQVHWGSAFSLYDNGVLYVSFASGFGYTLHSYYKLNYDLTMSLAFRYAEWHTFQGTSYSVGENAHDESSARVPYSTVKSELERVIGNAKVITLTYYKQSESEMIYTLFKKP